MGLDADVMGGMKFIHLLLPLALSLPVQVDAEGLKSTSRLGGRTGSPHTTVSTPVQPDMVRRFVESNIRETLYHELGHAIIDVADMPVFGPEEFAVDMFAVVLINQLHSEDDVVAMTYDIAAAYDAGAHKESTAGDGDAMWDVHGTDRQRYYNLACLMYGANPDEREDVITELDLPEERAETCEEEYDMTSRAWGNVLGRLSADAPGQSLKMDWTLDTESPLTRFVASEVDRLNEIMVLPEEVAISVIPCDEANAFYDPAEKEVIICTEMDEYLADLAR